MISVIVWISVLISQSLFSQELATNQNNSQTASATFSMYWYWTGEATLGRVPGVLSSKIGHLSGSEIVEVEYDPAQTNLQEMVAALKKKNSFYSVVVEDEAEKEKAGKLVRKDEIKANGKEPHFIESKYSLRTRHADLYYLDLTEAQAIALNSWSYFGSKMPSVLTETQKALRKRIKAKMQEKRPNGLLPVRAGEGLIKYRKELLEWLES